MKQFPFSARLSRYFRDLVVGGIKYLVEYRDFIIGSGIFIVAAFTLMIFGDVVAAESTAYQHKHSKQNHSRVGSHGMVLITDGTNLYASHLPLYHPPHDLQLIYEVHTSNKPQIIDQLKQHKTITILPSIFDLNILADGQPLSISTQIFNGHFERGGKLWITDTEFKFLKPIYKRALTNLPSKNQKEMAFDTIQVANTKASIFVHKIQKRPSFDIIVLGDNCRASVNVTATMFSAELLATAENTTLTELNQLVTVPEIMKMCDDQQILYFETKDFK